MNLSSPHLLKPNYTIVAISALCLLLSPMILRAASHPTAPKRNIYYISSSGNDTNDGLSEKSPWKTIIKLEAGNTYLLKRGDTLYFTINHLHNTQMRKIVIDVYGKGAKPVISLYKTIRPNAWQQQAHNIWKVDLKNTANYSGYLGNDDTNVGFINIDGAIKGAKYDALDLLKNPWDFYSDDRFIYVYSINKPSQLGHNIQITTKKNIINLSDSLEINHLKLIGSGAHAIQGAGSKNVIINDLYIADIGGSYLGKQLRYGNGIEFWAGATNCLVTGCYIERVYDVAVTMQSSAPGSFYENVIFRDNVFKDNEQSFEFEVGDSVSYFKNCLFQHNRCENAGFGWSHNIRPDKTAGVHILCYKITKGIGGIIISNNTFVKAKSGYIWFNPTSATGAMFISHDNQICLSPAVPIKSQNKNYYVKDATAFTQYFKLEQNSVFKPID